MEEIRNYLGADSIGYLSVESMARATGQPESKFCLACFTGDYPVPVDPSLDKYIMERRRSRPNQLIEPNAQPELFDTNH